MSRRRWGAGSRAALLAGAMLVAACEGPVVPVGPETVVVSPSPALIVGVGKTLRFTATVLDASGAVLAGAAVTWEAGDPAVATIDAAGVATAVGAGVTAVTARADGAAGTASLEVYVPPLVDAYEPGEVYEGRRGYVEYLAGDLPLVLSAGHGGALEPAEIPDRTYGTLATDHNTRELTLAVLASLLDRTGGRPHVVISNLRRTKLDPNREIEEAAQGNPFAENAWREYHGFIEEAKEAVAAAYGAGLYIDIHGHGHDIPRLELGYLLSRGDLQQPDTVLDAGGFAAKSSIRELAGRVAIPFSALLRGPTSLGALLAERGVRAVPSATEPHPGDDPYFTGGYSTARHGSRDGGTISGVQIEHHYSGIRDSAASREAYAAILAAVLDTYFAEHFGMALAPAVLAGAR